MQNNIVAIHCVVSGLVQGVGFRWFVEKTANNTGVSGWVRNLPDGNVEIEAEGRKQALEIFLKAIETGHGIARVNSVEIEWFATAKNSYKSFEITH